VFSHAQAVRVVVSKPELDDRGKMLRFWRKSESPAIGNAETVSLAYSKTEWALLA
jgi:hypothetical protein